MAIIASAMLCSSAYGTPVMEGSHAIGRSFCVPGGGLAARRRPRGADLPGGSRVFRDAASFETHRTFGYTLEFLPLVLLVLGLIAGLGSRAAGLAATIFGLFLLQSVFVGLRADAPEVAALHPVNGFLITILAIMLARDAWLGRRASKEAAVPPRGPAGDHSAT
jgi:hypothetical protein